MFSGGTCGRLGHTPPVNMESEKRTQLLELLVKENGYKGDVANLFDPNTPYVSLSLHFCAHLKMLEDFKAIWEAKKYLLHVSQATLLEVVNACENDEELRSCMDFLLEKNAFEGGMIENFIQRQPCKNRSLFCLWALENAEILKLDMARLTMTEITPCMLEAVSKILTKEWAKYVMPATFSCETRGWLTRKFFPHAEFKLSAQLVRDMVLENGFNQRIFYSLIGHSLSALDLYLSRFAAEAKEQITLLDFVKSQTTWCHYDFYQCIQSHLQFTKEEVLANNAEVFKWAFHSAVLTKWLLNTFEFTAEELDVESLLRDPAYSDSQKGEFQLRFCLPDCLKALSERKGNKPWIHTAVSRYEWLKMACPRSFDQPCDKEAVIAILKFGPIHQEHLKTEVSLLFVRGDIEMLEVFYNHVPEEDRTESIFVHHYNLFTRSTVEWLCSKFTLTKESLKKAGVSKYTKLHLAFAVKLLKLQLFAPEEIELESRALLVEDQELLREFLSLMKDLSPEKKRELVSSVQMASLSHHTETKFNIIAELHDFCPFPRKEMRWLAIESIRGGQPVCLDWLLNTFDFELWEIYTDKIDLQVVTILKNHYFLELMYKMSRSLGECYDNDRLQWAKNLMSYNDGSHYNYLQWIVDRYMMDIKDDTLYTALLESIPDIYRAEKRRALDKVFQRDNFVERMTAKLKQAGDGLKMKDVSLVSLMSFLEQFNKYKTSLEQTGQDVEQEKKLEALFESIVQHQ